MGRPTGGRGHKATGSVHIRVPLPIQEQVRQLVNHFYDNGDNDDKLVKMLPSLEEATVFAEEIVSYKKSARVSLSKLLEKIYGQEVEL
jgi:hypothetical protein